jgi:hypothetical protein
MAFGPLGPRTTPSLFVKLRYGLVEEPVHCHLGGLMSVKVGNLPLPLRLAMEHTETPPGHVHRIPGAPRLERLATLTAKVVRIDVPGFQVGLARVPVSRGPPDHSLLPPDDVCIQGSRRPHF